jgi:GTPase SAR1 family protein
MRDREGFILVYDITSRSSVEDLNDLYSQILRNKSISPTSPDSKEPAFPLVLVGNKLDLAMERKVSHQRGKALSQKWGCPHYETSARTRTNVDEIFYDLARQIMNKQENAVKARKESVASLTLTNGKETHPDINENGVSCCCVS